MDPLLIESRAPEPNYTKGVPLLSESRAPEPNYTKEVPPANQPQV